MPDLRNEWWLAERVYGKELCTVFGGVTDVEIRRDRMRAAIIKRGLQETLVSKASTFARAFERCYGQSLVARAKRIA
jgi:hypothetical protein